MNSRTEKQSSMPRAVPQEEEEGGSGGSSHPTARQSMMLPSGSTMTSGSCRTAHQETQQV